MTNNKTLAKSELDSNNNENVPEKVNKTLFDNSKTKEKASIYRTLGTLEAFFSLRLTK